MALGTTRKLLINSRGAQVYPCSVSSNWINAIDAGRVATADNASITNPDTQIVNASTHIISRDRHAGTLLKIRLAYTGTPSTDPVLVMFGRSGVDKWERLINKSDSTTSTLTTAVATDVTDGTLFYTQVTDDHTFDCNGCDELLIGVQTAFNGTVTTTAVVQAKII